MAENLTPTAGPGQAAVVEMSAPHASPPGYELIDEIGHGGMGVVYRARDTTLDRDVAVKLLSDHYPADSPAAHRFLCEARITGQLQHPGIPAVHQVGTLADGRPFLAMKLIKGSTLESILKHPPDPAADRGRLLAIFETVCQAVGYAHAHRVIHRDLKPANVMVGAFGEVQVMDWGLAKVLGEEKPATAEALAAEPTRATAEALAAELTQAWTQVGPTPEAGSHTQAGSLIGTPAFMPPEQAVGQIERVNERSDVFGLGALLAVILTSKPPYVGETFESVRVQAVRGKLEDCFARLDASGAEPEWVALCTKCLAFEPDDRPADAGTVAAAVAELRAAADERARRAELERVRVEGEQATALARSAERRKRRRLALGAATVLAVAALGGLGGVVLLQRQANAAMAAERERAEARFELARKAIATFHTGVSEDALLQNDELKGLRTSLLKQAAGFYADLQALLEGQTDAESRRLLADGYFQLGQLTAKIGETPEALRVHRQALAIRREVAAADPTPAARLDVARSLNALGQLLLETGDRPGSLAALREQRDLSAAVLVESPSDDARDVLAAAHRALAAALWPDAEAVPTLQEAVVLWEALVDSHSDVSRYRRDLGLSLSRLGGMLDIRRDCAAARAALEKAVRIQQVLADAHPADAGLQDDLTHTLNRTALVLGEMGNGPEEIALMERALAVRQGVVRTYRAVSTFQVDLARSHRLLAGALARAGRISEAVGHYEQAQGLLKKLVADNPTVTEYRFELAWDHNHLGRLYVRQGRFAEALAELDEGLAIRQKLADSEPDKALYANHLGYSYAYRGEAHMRAGHPAKAVADLRQSIALWDKEKASNTETRFERSRALALLAGLSGEARSGVTPAEAAAFADQAVASLRDAINAGWNEPDELKERDFGALRGQDDFKKLVAEMEAKSGSKAKPNE
jgi:tetratricopeptide (TPR) repeat protein/tRNA A-37 threonylcarbamoyl transferase component Bud32